MTRLFLFSLAALSACHEPGSAEGFRDRNPAMRTTDYGYSYDIVHPMSDDQRVGQVAVGSDLVAVVGRHEQCQRVSIYLRQDVRNGVRAPRQYLRSCSDDPIWERVSYADGTLLFGRDLYRLEANGLVHQGEVPLRRDLELLDHAVLDGNRIALLTEGTLHLVGFDGSAWIEDQRLATAAQTVLARGDLLAVGEQLYRDNGSGWEVVAERSLGFTDALDDRYATPSGSPGGCHLREIDDNALIDNGDACVLTPFGSVISDGYPTAGRLTFFDRDQQPLGVEERNRLVLAAGETSVVYLGREYDPTARWVEVTDGRPPGQELLSTSGTVDRGDWARESFEVPAGLDTLTVVLEGTGDADLYLARGDEPTYTLFDCSPYRAGSDELCVIESPTEGTWHVGVNGFAPTSDFVLRASVE